MPLAASPETASEGAQPVPGTPARWIGRAAIAGLWLVAGYLATYVALMLVFGPDRLHELLGSKTYNALIAGGGLVLLGLLVAGLILWSPPVAAGFLLTLLCLRPFRRRIGRRTRRWLLAAGALALPILLNSALLDGWQGTVLGLCLDDDTEYAPHYSAWGFRRIRAGMSESDVRALAGEPLERYAIAGSPGDHGWRWTRSPHSRSYRLRVVIFRAGKVSEKLSELYLD